MHLLSKFGKAFLVYLILVYLSTFIEQIFYNFIRIFSSLSNLISISVLFLFASNIYAIYYSISILFLETLSSNWIFPFSSLYLYFNFSKITCQLTIPSIWTTIQLLTISFVTSFEVSICALPPYTQQIVFTFVHNSSWSFLIDSLKYNIS